ncbi:hypothetical protein C8R48DRAFT_680293 [Suillus tomentosus]|nr:hypothetical protein C8R48DRAFT_680293 [Suillus tomentosus]
MCQISLLRGEALGIVLSKRKKAIKTWFRWRTNAARLERVKVQADAVIQAENITTRGKRLSKRKYITRATYATEDDDVKAQVKEKHQEALADWKQKRDLAKTGAILDDVDQDSKISELGAHLDRIFRHLSHNTGGLKFTCIAGGRDPSSGEVVVLDFHLGETESGDDFSAYYAGFEDIQISYVNFTKVALNNDAMKTVTDNGTAEKESDMDDGTDANSDGDDDFTGIVQDDGGGVEENGSENHQWMDVFYHQAAHETELPQATGIVQPFELHIPNSLPFNEFDFSGLQMGDTAMYTTPLLPPFDMANLNYFMDTDINIFDTSFDFSTLSSLPTPGPIVSQDYSYDMDQYGNTCDNPMSMKPPFPDNAIIPSASVLPAIPPTNDLESSLALTPAVQSSNAVTDNCSPATATSACGVLGTSNSDSHTHQSSGPQENSEGPRQTTRRHVPSMREHVDNAIGSSSVHTHMPVADGKENNKRRANPVGTLHRSSKSALEHPSTIIQIMRPTSGAYFALRTVLLYRYEVLEDSQDLNGADAPHYY